MVIIALIQSPAGRAFRGAFWLNMLFYNKNSPSILEGLQI